MGKVKEALTAELETVNIPKAKRVTISTTTEQLKLKLSQITEGIARKKMSQKKKYAMLTPTKVT